MSKFRTIHISNPQYELGNLRHIVVKSTNLKGRGDISVYVPEDRTQQRLPLVLLLHGVYGSHWSWAYHAGIHKKMDEWIASKQVPPMALAMPSDGLWGDGSGYVPHTTQNFEKWIAEDVVEAVLETILQVDEKSPLFIAGLSMGGFGALRIGAAYHEKFKGISGLSSITHISQMALFVEEELEHYKQHNPVDESVLETLITHKDKLPKLRFDCGLQDNLLEANRELHQQLERNAIPHIYNEFPGEHNWEYWGNIF
ncbi:esterase family protein [Flagellimonas sp. HMM57]|uniref:alpha/beta hydrolase n=1 Tax=Flagellimonas sp. HMM57 TaxID=2905121 RepID=UPI001EECF11D|nr:alpha/beta hydrolase-fold protein [Flagellimonas sp. HMM57]UII74767.1 esterase family protein [Flagellimonas sp. HMM57]